MIMAPSSLDQLMNPLGTHENALWQFYSSSDQIIVTSLSIMRLVRLCWDQITITRWQETTANRPVDYNRTALFTYEKQRPDTLNINSLPRTTLTYLIIYLCAVTLHWSSGNPGESTKGNNSPDLILLQLKKNEPKTNKTKPFDSFNV